MKSGSIFWGIFFISMGTSFLLSNFSIVDFSCLSINYIWPIILIMIGISLLKISDTWKKLFSGVSGLLLALFVVGTVSSGISCVKNSDILNYENWEYGNVQERNFFIENNTVSESVLNFKGGAGDFTLNGFGDSTNIFKAHSFSHITTCNSYLNNDSVFVVNFEYNNNLKSIPNISDENSANLHLNSAVNWHLNFKTGACNMDLNLKTLIIKDLTLQTGASDINIELGNLADTCNVNIKNGISNIKMYLPKDVHCKIYSKSALSNESFIGFEDKGEYYEAKSEQPTDKLINIKIKGGISDYLITRY